METTRGLWIRSSNLPNCRGCKRIGREWLYKVGYQVVMRVDACHHCDEAEKAKAMDSLPEKYR